MKLYIKYENGNLDVNDISVNQRIREYYQKLKDSVKSAYEKAREAVTKTSKIKIEGNLELKVDKESN